MLPSVKYLLLAGNKLGDDGVPDEVKEMIANSKSMRRCTLAGNALSKDTMQLQMLGDDGGAASSAPAPFAEGVEEEEEEDEV